MVKDTKNNNRQNYFDSIIAVMKVTRRTIATIILGTGLAFSTFSCKDQNDPITELKGEDGTMIDNGEYADEESEGSEKEIGNIALAEDEVLVDGQVRKVDYWIETSDTYVKASDKPEWNKPGVVLAFRAGTGPRPRLTLIGFKGSASEPIVITNKDKVEIAGTDAGQHALKFIDAQHVRVLGNGNPEHYYGIHISESGSSGFSFDGKSTDFEVAYTHIENTGFAGILAKTDDAQGWTMTNVRLHHNHIHHVHGEGMYIGQTKVDKAHDIVGLKVYNNLIHDTGWDLFQVANVTGDIEVYNNTMINGGTSGVPMQNQGFQIGDWSTGKYYNNIIADTHSRFLFIKGGHSIELYNNYFSGSGKDVEGAFLKTEARVDRGAMLEIRDNFFRDYEGVLFKSMIASHGVLIKDNKFSPRGDAKVIEYSGGNPNMHTLEGNETVELPKIELDGNYRIKSGSYYHGMEMGYEVE
ncbi:hypothetical protein GCM10023331_16850 [Algivirga pacifica]|uniref:Right handed beta helix region n=2 Tax=Algivirga pacifica TaxID=1162670 RepID=A0ABP9DBL9_9BACT